MMQHFANASGEQSSSSSVLKDMPTQISTVGCKDGYRKDAMLFVDENFSQTVHQRTTQLSVLSFRPVVKFNSGHYRYVVDLNGNSRIVQVGVGLDEHFDGLGFQQPLSARAGSGAANKRQFAA